MSKNSKINLISFLLLILAISMIYMGYTKGIWPPALTGLGFILLIWALRVVKQ